MPDDKRARFVPASVFAGKGVALSKPDRAATGASESFSSDVKGCLCRWAGGFHGHAGGVRLMTGRAGAAMRCSCPGRRGHGEGDGFVLQSGGSGSATGAALVPQAAEQRGAVSVRGLRARQEFPGASCAARVVCGLCALRRLPGVVFAPDGRLSGRFSARFGRRRGAEGQSSGRVLRS